MEYIELADVLSRWGRAHGYNTQEAIARALGMKQPTLSRKLRGKLDWTVTELHDMAQLLGCSMDVLYLLIA